MSESKTRNISLPALVVQHMGSYSIPVIQCLGNSTTLVAQYVGNSTTLVAQYVGSSSRCDFIFSVKIIDVLNYLLSSATYKSSVQKLYKHVLVYTQDVDIVCVCVYVCVCVCVCVCNRPSVRPSFCLSVCLSVCLGLRKC